MCQSVPTWTGGVLKSRSQVLSRAALRSASVRTLKYDTNTRSITLTTTSGEHARDALHPVLGAAVEKLAIELPALNEAARRSRGLIDRATSDLRNAVPLPEEPLPLDVVLLGSAARQELTGESDFDYLVIAHGIPGLLEDPVTKQPVHATRKMLAALQDLQRGEALARAGGTGMFGQIVSAPDLIERIGLEKDTNETHSHRILLLEESVSIYQPELRERLLRAMLDRYLDDYRSEPKTGVPRFLLNDVERYWRTICVDYQAKHWRQLPLRLRAELGPADEFEWGLRYFKLLISRKLTFVGTVTSLILCKHLGIKQPDVGFLYEQFEMPALARLAQLHEHIPNDRFSDLGEALRVADEFNAKLSTEEFRDQAKRARDRSEIGENGELQAMRERADDLQACLERIFFSEPLRSASETYLSF